jgi:hypothetical protein
MPDKVVVHYRTGALLKGHTSDFSPASGSFTITRSDQVDAPPLSVHLSDLKAVFFVRDFVGDATYDEIKAFSHPVPPGVHRIEAHMLDGEVLVGSAESYEPEREGFFLVPADPRSNNARCFVVAAAVKRLSVI